MSPQRVSNYFDELTSRCRSLEDTTHKDTGLCQKCLAVSLGFRSNDQLIIYQVSSTFPKSRATTLSLSLSLGIGNVLGSRIIPAALPWWAPDSIFLRPTKIRLSLVQSAIAMVFRNTYLRVHDGTHCSRATRVIGEPYKIRIFSFFFFQSYEEKRKNRNRGRKLWKYPRWYIFNGWNLFKENEEMDKWRRASSSFFFSFYNFIVDEEQIHSIKMEEDKITKK